MVLAQFGEFDTRHASGMGEFHVRMRPWFPIDERYVPPSVAGRTGHEWEMVPYFAR